MKNPIVIISIAATLAGCAKYVTLSQENYETLYNGGNLGKVKARFEMPIEVEYREPDTVIATVDSRGTCKFNTVTRQITPIPGRATVRIKDAQAKSFTAEFEEYKLTLPMSLNSSGEYSIETGRDNAVVNSRYVVKESDPKLSIKLRNTRSKQRISLKK